MAAKAPVDIAMVQDPTDHVQIENNTLTTTYTSQSKEEINHLMKSNSSRRNKIAVLNPNLKILRRLPHQKSNYT